MKRQLLFLTLTICFVCNFAHAATKADENLADCDRVLTFFGEPVENPLRTDEQRAQKVRELDVVFADDAVAAPDSAELKAALLSFQKYDASLRRRVIEADAQLDAFMLSLLGRGHLFLIGGGGVGKSMIAKVGLENIIFDEHEAGILREHPNNSPLNVYPNRDGKFISLFEMQFTSSTTFPDVFGGINARRQFQEDGVKERNLKDGVTSRVFAFFDELPDADPRLLRSMLNLLNERKLAEGIPTYAHLMTAVATSNYYIPEIYHNAKRKGIKLEMFFDRFRYIAMIPSGFAHRGQVNSLTGKNTENSYQKMLNVVLDGQGSEVSPLPFRDLVRLQDLAKTVVIPEMVREFWELVSSRVDVKLKMSEQRAQEEYAALLKQSEEPAPPYRATKPITKRSFGAGAEELRNLVMLDWIRSGGQRALAANFTDVYRLQYFAGLVGPSHAELQLLRGYSGHDLAEKATLDTVDTEREAYITVWQEVVDELLEESSKQ